MFEKLREMSTKKHKHLFKLPSVWLPTVLTFLIQANGLINLAIEGQYIPPTRYVDLLFGIPVSLISAYLRYLEDDEVYTPIGFPGRSPGIIEENTEDDSTGSTLDGS